MLSVLSAITDTFFLSQIGAAVQVRGGAHFKQNKVMEIWIYKEDVFTFTDIFTKDRPKYCSTGSSLI